MSEKQVKAKKYNAYFEEVVNTIQPEIDRMNEFSVQGEGVFDKLIEKFAVAHPVLDKAATKVTIKEEAMRANKIPEGMELDSGAKVPVVTFRIPVKGATNAGKWVLESQNMFVDGLEARGGVLVLRHTSWDGPVENDEARLKKIRETAKNRFIEVDKVFEEFAAEAKVFNASLKAIIEPLVKAQRAKIAKRRKSEEKLNPFG